MITEIGTVCFAGIQAIPISVQVQIAGGFLPSFAIVGLPDKAVNEARDRVRSALHTLGIGLPAKRIIINLSPANIQKEGTHYDLPLALGILMAMDLVPHEWLSKALALGEMGLDGHFKPVPGILSAAFLAAKQGRPLICPALCGQEAVWGGDIEVVAPENLLQLIEHVRKINIISKPQGCVESHNPWDSLGDFSDIKGQESAKRACLIAAAGGHNILLSGPPGVGKSMLAARMVSILPDLSPAEALEVTMIHSIAGTLDNGRLMRFRPFRSPHHSISTPALIGGGGRSLPGEISLAHGGVLFLDELPEFSRQSLEALRQPLETGEAVVSRVNHRAVYPARFQLVAAMNPCKCGNLGDAQRQCAKAPQCGEHYQRTLSFPFLDRIDLFVEMTRVDLWQLAALQPKEERLPEDCRAPESAVAQFTLQWEKENLLASEKDSRDNAREEPLINLEKGPAEAEAESFVCDPQNCHKKIFHDSAEEKRTSRESDILCHVFCAPANTDASPFGKAEAESRHAFTNFQDKSLKRESAGILRADVGCVREKEQALGGERFSGSATMRKLVNSAWKRRILANFPLFPTALQMEKELARYPQAQKILLRAAQAMGLSARGYHRAARVARTIGFLEGSEGIEEHHIYEALSYRLRAKH